MSRIIASFFNPYIFDEEEREEIRALNSKLGNIINYSEDFMNAAILLEEIKKQITRAKLYSLEDRGRQCVGWKAIAGRDAIVTLFKIDETMHNISSSLSKIPRLANSIDSNMHREASKFFRKEFPDNNASRQAVVHSSDKTMNPKKIEQHSMKGNFDRFGIRISHAKNIIINDVWSPEGFSSNWNGKIRTAVIDMEKSNKLSKIIEQYVSAFNIGASNIREEELAKMRSR